MKMLVAFLMIGSTELSFAQSVATNVISGERIRIVHQDISKWDKNGDSKLTGSEREVFIAAKRNEMADAAAAAQVAKAKPPKPARSSFKPAMSQEDTQKRTPKGLPKNFEEVSEIQSK